MTRKPAGVTVVAAFLSIASLVAAFLAFTLLVPGTPADNIWHLNPLAYQQFKRFGGASGIFLLTVGAVAATAAIGLLRRRRWAWWLAVGIFAVNGAGDIVSFLITRDPVRSGSGALIAACFLFLLTRGKVRCFYQQPV